MKPLIYLEIRQFINSIKNIARNPKRLIPMLLFGGWMVSSLFMSMAVNLSGGGRPGPNFAALRAMPIETIETAIFVLLSIGSLMTLYGAFSSGMMVFSLAQIDFLFPVPISRRAVVVIKLIKDYAKYGFIVAFFYAFVAPMFFGAIGVAVFPWGLVGILALTSLAVFIINLAHTINIAFTFGYERLRHARLLIKAVLLAAPALIVVYGAYQYITTRDSILGLLRAVDMPIVSAIFAPSRWCTELVLAPLLGMTADRWLHLGLLCALAVASFLILLSRKENVYEPALGISAKVARRRQAVRLGNYNDIRVEVLRDKGTRRMGGASLPAFGRGAVALLWKNLLLRYRVSRAQRIAMVVIPIAVVYFAKRFIPEASVLRHAPFLLMYVVWIMSLTAHAEMRAGIKQVGVIKAMPIAAWKVMLVEVIGSVLYLTAGVVVFAAALWILVPQARGELLIACTLGIPFLAFATTSATVIPAMLYSDKNDFTQNYLASVMGFLFMSIAIVPSVVLGVAFVSVLRMPLYVAVPVISVANLIVGTAGVSIAGAVFRGLDPSGD